MTDTNKFSPVAFDPKAYAAKRRKTDAKFAVAYDALEDEFAALAAAARRSCEGRFDSSRVGIAHGRFATCGCTH